MLTQEILKSLYKYDPETGLFARVEGQHPSFNENYPVGTIHTKGYRRIKFGRKNYYCHRLAWLYVYGCWPEGQIDHKNGIKTDNRMVNLRAVNNAENHQNRRAPKNNNKLGLLGVVAHQGKWMSRIMTNGAAKYLGVFDSPESAHEAYVAAKRMLHPTCTI